MKSSNIKSIGYNAATKTMEVEFGSGTAYQYNGVPADLHEGLLSAESVGSFFAREVRTRFKGVSLKVLAPGHGFNSERSQRAENGGRP